MVAPTAQMIDAEGGLAIPAFHDAHIHLLSYARSRSRLDCHDVRSLAELGGALATWSRQRPEAPWVRAFGYDETMLAEARHPDRHDLDAVIPDRPARLQHRTLHVDVLNTVALRLAGLFDSTAPEVEREAVGHEPTGRLFHAAELLRGRIEHVAQEDLGRDVRAACRQLLCWGVTSVQDASVTNGRDELELFGRLRDSGDLLVRTYMFRGARHWRELDREVGPLPPRQAWSREGSGSIETTVQPRSGRSDQGPSIYLGPVKYLLDERTSDLQELKMEVAEARAAGHAVAIHAVSEAEVAVAIEALAGLPPHPLGRPPNRIEHGSVILDEMLADLRAAQVTIVGQPVLIARRGDLYRAAYPPASHGWLHRAASLVDAGIAYAVGSDAPIGDPSPLLGLRAARARRTPSGAELGPREALAARQALAAFTHWPAQAVGAEHDLGTLSPGKLSDIAVLDPDSIGDHPSNVENAQARMTIIEGQIVWRRR